jgi:hypothetical protein
VQRENRLLILALDRDRLDPRGSKSLQKGVAIDPVRLVVLPVRPDVAGRQQGDLEAECDQVSGPVMGGAARFHHDLAGLAGAPEAFELETGETLAFQNPPEGWAIAISKTSLARSTAISTLRMSWLLSLWVHSLATLGSSPSGRSPSHH